MRSPPIVTFTKDTDGGLQEYVAFTCKGIECGEHLTAPKQPGTTGIHGLCCYACGHTHTD